MTRAAKYAHWPWNSAHTSVYQAFFRRSRKNVDDEIAEFKAEARQRVEFACR
jgi:hypothetical protein